jgi:hypothetical protein
MITLTFGLLTLLAAPADVGPVFLPPIAAADASPLDPDVADRLREAVVLRVPPEARWRLGSPDPSVCRGGCRVLAITTTGLPRRSYRITLREEPRGKVVNAAGVDPPADATPAQVADALLLRCSFLVGLDLGALPPPPPPPPPARRLDPPRPRLAPPSPRPAPPPPRPADPRRRLRRVELSLGPAVLAGLESPYLGGGVELALAVRLHRTIYLRLGIVGLDASDHDGLVVPRSIWTTLLAGPLWTWRWFQLGLMGGAAASVHFVHFRLESYYSVPDRRILGLTGGPALSLRVAVRVHHRLSLGLNVLGIYTVNDLTISVSDGVGSLATYELPRGLLITTLDLALRV